MAREDTPGDPCYEVGENQLADLQTYLLLIIYDYPLSYVVTGSSITCVDNSFDLVQSSPRTALFRGVVLRGSPATRGEVRVA